MAELCEHAKITAFAAMLVLRGAISCWFRPQRLPMPSMQPFTPSSMAIGNLVYDAGHCPALL